MVKTYAICACLQFAGDGELVDKSKPFKTYYVEALTSEEAVFKFKKDFSMCIVTMYGKPIETIVTDEEYNNEQ